MQRRNETKSYAGYEDRETKEKLAELGKYARAYLRIKQDAKGRMKNDLKKVTKDRYALALHIEQLASPYEAVMNARNDNAAQHLQNENDCKTELDRLWREMDKSQRGLVGRGSKEFRDLYDAVKGFRNIENGQSLMNFGSQQQRKDTLRLINKLAQKYIDKKEIEADKEAKKGKKLNDTANTRLEIARNVRSFTRAFEQVIEEQQPREVSRQEYRKEKQEVNLSAQDMANKLYDFANTKDVSGAFLLQTRNALSNAINNKKDLHSWLINKKTTDLERIILSSYVLNQRNNGAPGELEQKLNQMNSEELPNLLSKMRSSNTMKNLRSNLTAEKVKNLFKKGDFSELLPKEELDNFLKPQEVQKAQGSQNIII